MLGGRGDLAKLSIITVAIVGTFIVILNIAAVIFLIRRKRGRTEDGTILYNSVTLMFCELGLILCFTQSLALYDNLLILKYRNQTKCENNSNLFYIIIIKISIIVK